MFPPIPEEFDERGPCIAGTSVPSAGHPDKVHLRHTGPARTIHRGLSGVPSRAQQTPPAMLHTPRNVHAIPALLLPLLLPAADKTAEPGNTGISSALAWLMVGAMTAVMIGFIWRNARKNAE